MNKSQFCVSSRSCFVNCLLVVLSWPRGTFSHICISVFSHRIKGTLQSLELPPSWAVPSILVPYCTYSSHLDVHDSYFFLLILRLLGFFWVFVPHSSCSVTWMLPPGRSWAIIGLTSFVFLLFRHCSFELPVSQMSENIWFIYLVL